MECGMVGWSASRLAGWLVAWLPLCQSRTDQHQSTLLLLPLSLSSSYSLCVYMHDSCLENAWFGGVCVRFAEKKGGGVLHVLARRGGGGFRKEEIFQRALPSDRRRGGRMGHEILVSLFFLFFFPSFFLSLRFAFFGRANVILIARLSALLCEFARHFFISFHGKLLMSGREGW